MSRTTPIGGLELPGGGLSVIVPEQPADTVGAALEVRLGDEQRGVFAEQLPALVAKGLDEGLVDVGVVAVGVEDVDRVTHRLDELPVPGRVRVGLLAVGDVPDGTDDVAGCRGRHHVVPANGRPVGSEAGYPAVPATLRAGGREDRLAVGRRLVVGVE